MENLHEGHRSRLRDKFYRVGLEGFQDHEVLELLLTYAIPRKDVNELAHLLLNRFGSLEKVLSARSSDLETVPGIGRSTSVFLNLIFQVQLRIVQQSFELQNGRPRFRNVAELGKYAITLVRNEKNENFYILCLDDHSGLIHTECLSVGTPNLVEILPRRISEAIIQRGASKIILMHNHPSGDVSPSPADTNSTKELSNLMRYMKVEFADDLIVSSNAVYSSLRDTVLLYTNYDEVQPMSLAEYKQLLSLVTSPHRLFDQTDKDPL